MISSRHIAHLQRLARDLVARSGQERPVSSCSAGKQRLTHYWPDSSPHSGAFAARFPDADKLIAMARLAAKKRYQFWHPWHMEPTHSPTKGSGPSKYVTVRTGDPEWTHALLRFSHVFDLGAAYALTRETLFVEACITELQDFAVARLTYGDRAILQNQLDAALRVLNVIRSHDLVKDGKEIPEVLLELMEAIAYGDCRYLAGNLGKRVGNWEFFISTALLVAGEYFSDWAEAPDYIERAHTRLTEVLKTEISGDHIEIEEAPMYSGECILAMLDYLLVRVANGRSLPDEMVTPLRGMVLALNRLKDPHNLIPPIGDSDTLDVPYINRYAEIVLGTLGELTESRESPSNSANAGDSCTRLSLFPDTGWAISRWRNSDTEWYLLFDASGRPPERRSWHAHADDLQVLLHSNKTDLFVDPGRFTYASHYSSSARTFAAKLGVERIVDTAWSLFKPRACELNQTDWRGYFRRTLRHNTVSCNELDQPGYESSRTPGTKRGITTCRSTGPMMLVEGSSSYRSADNGRNVSPEYEHRRTVLAMTPTLVLFIDDLQAASQCNWVSSLHLHPDIMAKKESGRIVLEAPGLENPCVFVASSDGNSRVNIENDWVSPVYNLKIPAKTIRASVDGVQRVQLVTVVMLAPLVKQITECQCSVQFESTEAKSEVVSTIVEIQEKDAKLLVSCSPNGMAINRRDMQTDARVAMARYDRNGLVHAGILGGQHLCVRGDEIFAKCEGGDYFAKTEFR